VKGHIPQLAVLVYGTYMRHTWDIWEMCKDIFRSKH
jgi:hypothetical protein